MLAAILGLSLVGATAWAEDLSDVKGALLFAGGELRFDNAAVWRRFVSLAGGKGTSVIVVPAAVFLAVLWAPLC